jgi:hypothetical protein
MAPPKVRFLTKIYHPNIGVLPLSPSKNTAYMLSKINSDVSA